MAFCRGQLRTATADVTASPESAANMTVPPLAVLCVKNCGRFVSETLLAVHLAGWKAQLPEVRKSTDGGWQRLRPAIAAATDVKAG